MEETLESLIEKDIKKMFSERGDRQVNIGYIKEELKKYYILGTKTLADKAKEKIDISIKDIELSTHSDLWYREGLSDSKELIDESLTELKK